MSLRVESSDRLELIQWQEPENEQPDKMGERRKDRVGPPGLSLDDPRLVNQAVYIHEK